MSAAAPAFAPTAPPAPTPAGTGRPARIASLLTLVRKLIDYGRELAATLRERGLPDPADAGTRFGTLNVALILARITAGLHRAAALEARLQHAATDPDAELGLPPLAEPSEREYPPRAARPPAPPAAEPDPRIVRLPTPQRIAEEVRRRPVGEVIIDICHDLGITPDHPLWRELHVAIFIYDGSLARYLKTIWQRADAARDLPATPPAAPPTPSPPQRAQPASTGPP